jgi:[protein-PII] uridylyltransferase
MSYYRGIAAARTRSDTVDGLVAGLSQKLPDAVAVVALGAYGRYELTPRSEIDLLFLNAGQLSTRLVSELVCYPLWERDMRVEPTLRTLAECAADARRSWSAAASFLDARFLAGDPTLFETFARKIALPWRRDRERLRHRLRSEVQRRHAAHMSAAASTTPDLVAGRGGLLDLQALRWLNFPEPRRLTDALEFLLETFAAVEELAGHVPHRLSRRLQDRLATALNLEGDATSFLSQAYTHTRWIAFSLDSALATSPDDRHLGPSLALRRGELVVDRPPPVERVPSLGLRAANLVGLAPPAAELISWASEPGPPMEWDAAALEQFWLLLRAADWRAWDFLDVTGLLVRYLPELAGIWRRPGPSAAEDLALDTHSFMAVRRLHEWTDRDDPLAERAWRPVRRPDWLYLSVLMHELGPAAATSAAERLGLPEDACATIGFAVENYRLLAETATRRDLHDEDLLTELATRIRTPQRLSQVFLVAAAHDLASGPSAWTTWKADLMRQLFGRLEVALRQSGRTRSLDQHRARIVRQLQRKRMDALLPIVPRLPRRYVLARSPAFVARHLAVLDGQTLSDGEVRMQAHRHRQPGLWDVMLVARDRPGLLATVAGVLALRGTSVLAADAATCADGLVLDVFTVAAAHGEPLAPDRWPEVAADLQAALEGRVPLRDLLGARRLDPDEAEAIQVNVDNAASQFFSVVEVRAPDQVGLLYRITRALHELGLDIHHAKIATYPEGVLDVFYVWDLSGEKLDEPAAQLAAGNLAAWLRGEQTPSE